MLLVLLFLHAGNLLLFQHVEGFTQKNECLLDFVHDEYEADEHEGGGAGHVNQAWPHHNGGAWPQHTGGAWPAPPPTALNSFVAQPTGFRGGMDMEDLRERMGLDEEEEEGMGHAFGGGRGVYGGRFGAGEEMDEREWGRDKRRRRRSQAFSQGYGPLSRHSPTSLFGTLTCDQASLINIFNVTVGYSATSYCYQAFSGCQAGSPKATQVIHCHGRSGSCDFTIRRHFISRCGQMVNFANVAYECVPASKRINICSNTSSDIPGAVAIASPSYPLATGQRLPPKAELLTCECILRAPSDSTFEVENLRTHMSQKDGYCDGDMVLLERPDLTSGSLTSARYSLERELCGVNVSSHLDVPDSILRVTFLGGAPIPGDTAGFLGTFRARGRSGQSELFHISCTGTDPAPVTTPSSRLSEWRRSRNPSPTGHDLAGAAKSQGHVGELSESNMAAGELPVFGVGGGDVVEENKGSKTDPGEHKKRLRRRVEEEETAYAEYQSQDYYDGVKTRANQEPQDPLEAQDQGAPLDQVEHPALRVTEALLKDAPVPRRNPRSPHQAPASSRSSRWSDSKLAEYGLMLVRVLGGQGHTRRVGGRIPGGTGDGGGGGGAGSAADGGSSGETPGSSNPVEVYCVSTSQSEEGRVEKCEADVHRSLRPPTRRAPRPPRRPAPVLNQSNTPATHAISCHKPVAPPRRQKTTEEDSSASVSPYDNALDPDVPRAITPPQDAGCDGDGARDSGACLAKHSEGRFGETAADNPNYTIVAEIQAGSSGSDDHNEGKSETESLSEDVDVIDKSTQPQKDVQDCGEVCLTLESEDEYKAVLDAENESESESKPSSSAEIPDDVSDVSSEGEETYTSINELNEALYNLQEQIRDLP
ncbi:hypothetical protein EGW08_021101 [Elysia chlorotica]|uniref:CUB domain-containing protein n=1 Tax=Elysia chlorotica TaxID=188477 RepID=A0A433SPI1_ELYCH|nr:hypothetical protein EGW08_021101 [Elysia chlorotica]